MGAKLPWGILPLETKQLGGFVTLTVSWVQEEAETPLEQDEKSSSLPKCACLPENSV